MLKTIREVVLYNFTGCSNLHLLNNVQHLNGIERAIREHVKVIESLNLS